MTAIIIFIIFFTALLAVQLDHFNDVPVTTTVTWVSLTCAIIAAITFFYYPYSALPDMAAKAAQATELSAYCAASVCVAFLSALIGAHTER
jgi:hypothetical protein